MPCAATSLLQPTAVGTLRNFRGQYASHYDDVFYEVHERLQAAGSATKLDLAALIAWKHVQNAPWMQTLLNVPGSRVSAVTSTAFAESSDDRRIRALRPLPGFGSGGAYTSVLLAAWEPDAYGVLDKGALTIYPRVVVSACACDWSDLVTYFDHLRRVAEEMAAGTGDSWRPRDVDMALFEMASNAPS